jgi:hypothetical protein
VPNPDGSLAGLGSKGLTFEAIPAWTTANRRGSFSTPRDITGAVRKGRKSLFVGVAKMHSRIGFLIIYCTEFIFASSPCSFTLLFPGLCCNDYYMYHWTEVLLVQKAHSSIDIYLSSCENIKSHF